MAVNLVSLIRQFLTPEHVAEASKEGGFLGIVRICEAEKATLTEISSALKLAACSVHAANKSPPASLSASGRCHA